MTTGQGERRKAISDDWRSKRYGRIRGGDLETLLKTLREAWSEGRAVRASLIEPEAAKFWQKVASTPHWGALYSLTFNQLIALVVKITGTAELLASIAESPNPTDRMMREFPAALDEVDLPDDPLALPVILALLANLDAISRFSLTVNDLMANATERQCILSLARAASVDTAILALQPAQLFMRSLQISGDTESLGEFLRVVAAGPHRGREVYQELRWAEYLLRDQGAFEQCTHDEIHDLLVRHLKLYDDDSKLRDSKKSLAMVFRKWRKESGN